MIVFLNGKFVESSNAKISIFDHGFLYGDGCFETLRTYNGKLFRPQEHLKRLLSSVKGLQINIPWSITEMANWMQKAIEKNGFVESRLRITITRGENNYQFIGSQNPTILIVVTELIPHPQAIYTQGAIIETIEAERLLPQIKSHNLLASTLGQQEKTNQKAFETVLINHDGYLTEGSISNFFIIKNGVILTAPEKLVLSGITRDIIFDLGKNLQLKVVEKTFSLKEACQADEAFLTSTTLDIAPVVQIGTKKIGEGSIGKITKKLMEKFYQYIQNSND